MGKPAPLDADVEQHAYKQQQPSARPYRAPSPSILLIFSYCTKADVVLGLCPAILISLAAGGVAPLMTLVVGQAFDAMAVFTTSADLAAREQLMHSIKLVSLELVALAVGTLVLDFAMAFIWLWLGERIIMRIRHKVFAAVSSRDIEWFDLLNEQSTEGPEDSVGAGGLLAKFARDTDDVRMGITLTCGNIIQKLATFVVAFTLAVVHSWSLTFVILATIPVIVFVQGCSQAFAQSPYNEERNASAAIATRIERAVASIVTVKAFSAVSFEVSSVKAVIDAGVLAYRRCCTVWAIAFGTVNFLSYTMFVQGFWYGALLVHRGKLSVGSVAGVFWACLIAGTNLQMIMPMLIPLQKAKTAMVSLEMTIKPPPSDSSLSREELPSYDESVFTAKTASSATQSKPSEFGAVAKSTEPLRPPHCTGTFEIPSGLTFSYAARADARPALNITTPIHVAQELLFFVGGSGSGKSTLAQILLGMYQVQRGHIYMDDIPLERLDKAWIREHVALVSQECLVFDMSIHDNVALGRLALHPAEQSVSREEIERACRVAMVHDFVHDLPDGYDTMLGSGGANLSGGQKQRVALARAVLRDPSVLILDEATSALDPISRVLVFEAIKQIRRFKTTIVITHDLSQITADDYVYVMKNGTVVEDGFRHQLELVPLTVASPSTDEITEENSCGEFRRMLDKQILTGGYLPTRDDVVIDVYESIRAEANGFIERVLSPEPIRARPSSFMNHPVASSSAAGPYVRPGTAMSHASSMLPSISPSVPTKGSWQMDAVRDILGPSNLAIARPKSYRRRGSAFHRAHRRPSAVKELPLDGPECEDDEESLQDVDASADDDETIQIDEDGSYLVPVKKEFNRHHLSPSVESLPSPSPGVTKKFTRYSMTFEPRSPVDFSMRSAAPFFDRSPSVRENTEMWGQEPDHGFPISDDMVWDDRRAMEVAANQSAAMRQQKLSVHSPPPPESSDTTLPITVSSSSSSEPTTFGSGTRSLISIIREFWPTVPNKFALVLGLLISAISGALTPVFSYFLARLMSELGSSSHDSQATIMKWGMLVLITAVAFGAAVGLRFFILENCAMHWLGSLRANSFAKIMAQDKAWFDDSQNSPERIVGIVMKDGDDARTLIATVASQSFAVIAMLGLGIGWALVIGWQLTCVGFVLVPVFGGIMAFQSHYSDKFELKSKRAREEVARNYFEVVANVRAIRSMALESVFEKHFLESLKQARRTCLRGSVLSGVSFGLANALVYLAEALVFFVGAALMARGTYSYLQLVEVIDLILFTVNLGSQMMTFVPLIAKSKQAAADFSKVLKLGNITSETRGIMRVPISGDITFEDVGFSYPTRPNVPVLRGIDATIKQGECVAIVGASGSGKSTIASLLQRLYEPTSGRIAIGGSNIADTDVSWLRDHVAVVSQNPSLFDASIADNIAYGCDPSRPLFMEDIQSAARDAQLHDFVMSLPNGYETMIGEKAALLSGGQAQRLSIARSLAKKDVQGRSARIMVFDECTSALDAANQEAVIKTIMNVKAGKTTMLITHKLPVMQMCDRILMIDAGCVVEEGKYHELMARNGVFAQHANGGEWT